MHPVPDSEKYDYQTLDSDKKEVRLLKLSPRSFSFADPLCCSVVTASLSQASAPDYFAISYSWALGEECANIMIDSSSLQVPKSAEKAVRNVARVVFSAGDGEENQVVKAASGDVLLWIDAICIDQRNLIERGQQVSIMRDVYSQAAQVIVWLGDVDKDVVCQTTQAVHIITDHCRVMTDNFANLGSQIIRKVEVGYVSLYSDGGLPASCDWNAIRAMYSVRWFTRLWVVQEVVLGNKACSVYGARAVPWQDVALAAAWMVHRQYYQSAYCGSVVEGIENAARILKYTRLRRSEAFSLFGLALQMECSVPMDKIYSIHGLLPQAMADEIPTDYERPLVSTFAQATKALIRHTGTLDVLQYAMAMFPREDSQKTDVDWPSWIPRFDWSYHTSVGSPPFIAVPHEKGADNGLGMPSRPVSSADDRHLSLTELIIGTVGQFVYPTTWPNSRSGLPPLPGMLCASWQAFPQFSVSCRREQSLQVFIFCVMKGRGLDWKLWPQI